MVKVYESIEKLPQGTKILRNCSAYFNLYARIEDFGELEFCAMKEIDSAVPLEVTPNLIKIPFGVTTIKSLSSGCKTVIVYLYLCRNYKEQQPAAISNISCGYNAMEILFQCMEELQNDKVLVLLEHLSGLYECQNREYLVDDEIIVTEACLL